MEKTLTTLMGIIIAFVIFAISYSLIEKEIIIPECIEDGYEVYLDGEEVDADTIDINMYQVSIDREKECIYLTKKDNNTSFLPVIIPMH